MTEIDINEILKDHVTLDVECIDRIYLNGYIPNLQTPGQLVKFLHHRGYEIPSPAILGKLTDEYKAAVEAFAKGNGIPLFHFERGVRKDDIAAEYRARHGEAEGVLFIGIAQERVYAYKARKRVQGQKVFFDYSRHSVFVNHYYFYIQDDDFGPVFIKVCTYAPYAVRICLNGLPNRLQHGYVDSQSAPVSIFATDKSSSSSGQCKLTPLPPISYRARCSGVASYSNGNQISGTLMMRPSLR